MTNLRIRRVLTVVWIIPGLVAAPNLYPATSVSQSLYSHFGEFTRVTCFDGFSDDFRFGYFMSLFVFMYLLPLGFIAVTCFSIARVLLKEIPVQPRRDPRAHNLEQGRRKVAKMVLVVVFSFIVCWSPYFIVTAVTQLQTESFLYKSQYFFTMLLINLLAFTNSCVNPFVYFAMSARFRKGFMCILRSFRNCSRRSRFPSDNSQSSLRHVSHNRTINGVMSLHSHPIRRNSVRTPRQESILPMSSSRGGGRGGGSRPNVFRGTSTSSNPATPYNSTTTGNTQARPIYHHSDQDDRCTSCSRSSRTLLLQINHCRSPTCCTHLVPLMTDGNGRIMSQDNLEQIFPWGESCDL